MDTLLTLLRLCCMLDWPPCQSSIQHYPPTPFKIPYPTHSRPPLHLDTILALLVLTPDALLTLLVHLHLTPGHHSMWTLSFPCPNIPLWTTFLTYSGYDIHTILALSSQTRSFPHMYSFLTTFGFQQPIVSHPPFYVDVCLISHKPWHLFLGWYGPLRTGAYNVSYSALGLNYLGRKKEEVPLCLIPELFFCTSHLSFCLWIVKIKFS